MSDFFAALGLVLVIEGIAFAAFPAIAKRAIAASLEMADGRLRTAGLFAAIVGVLIVYLVRG